MIDPFVWDTLARSAALLSGWVAPAEGVSQSRVLSPGWVVLRFGSIQMQSVVTDSSELCQLEQFQDKTSHSLVVLSGKELHSSNEKCSGAEGAWQKGPTDPGHSLHQPGSANQGQGCSSALGLN